MFYPYLVVSDKSLFLKEDTEVNESLACNTTADIVPLSQSGDKSEKALSLYFLLKYTSTYFSLWIEHIAK